MNIAFFISSRLSRKKELSFSSSIVSIAILSIAISLTVMILSLAVVIGFKTAIKDKLIGANSHIQIRSYSADNNLTSAPIVDTQWVYMHWKNTPNISHMQRFVTHQGIMKTKQDIEGVILKGVDAHYDWRFLQKHLTQGTVPRYSSKKKSDQLLMSSFLANRLNLTQGDTIAIYFIQDPPRVRRFVITGLFDTGMAEVDKNLVFVDIAHLQKLRGWTPHQISGLELFITDMSDIENTYKKVVQQINYDTQAITIQELYPHLFDWLSLIDSNAVIIIVLMSVVSMITIISVLLILILQHTPKIGLFKALGMTNKTIQRIFIYNAMYIVIKGLFWGNIIGIGAAYVQYYFHLIKLDKASYYLSEVPISLHLSHLLLLNIGVILCVFLSLLIPARVISRISPIKAIVYK